MGAADSSGSSEGRDNPHKRSRAESFEDTLSADAAMREITQKHKGEGWDDFKPD